MGFHICLYSCLPRAHQAWSGASAPLITYLLDNVQLLQLIREWMFDGSAILLVGPALARTLLVMPERTVPPMDTMDALALMADAIRRQQRAEQVQLLFACACRNQASRRPCTQTCWAKVTRANCLRVITLWLKKILRRCKWPILSPLFACASLTQASISSCTCSCMIGLGQTNLAFAWLWP